MDAWRRSRPADPEWRVHSEVAPRKGDPVFRQRAHKAFLETGLHTHLREHGIDTLIVTGIQTEYCVDTTIRRRIFADRFAYVASVAEVLHELG